MVEFGPGDSLGVGLCWLLSGADRFIALDAQQYTSIDLTLKIFDQVVALMSAKEPYPEEFPEMLRSFKDYGQPLGNFDLSAERLDTIRAAVQNMNEATRPTAGGAHITYHAPWNIDSDVAPDSIDLAYSQAVMEHVRDVPTAYEAMGKWVRPDGLISHNIDFRSHGTSFDWNGHWTYSHNQWLRANNVQTYRAINRIPPSSHIRIIQQAGFDIVNVDAHADLDGISRSHLSGDWRHITNDDLTWSVVHLLARKT